MPDEIVQDGSLASAARAIEALLSPREAPKEPAEQPTEQAASEAEEPAAESQETESEKVESESQETASTETTEDENESRAEAAKPAVSEPKEPESAKEEPKETASQQPARDQALDQLNTLIPQFQASLMSDFPDIKTEDDQIALAEKDPNRYNRYVIATMKLQRAMNAQSTLAAQKFKEWQDGEKVKLHKLLPDLKDPESDKAKKLASDILGYAQKKGYSAQHIQRASATDIVLMHNAMLFERGQAQAKADKAAEVKKLEEAKKKAQGAPPVQRPGVAKSGSAEDKVRADFQRLKKTGRLDDAAAVLDHIL